jgi:hypothetical protein
VHRPHAAPLFGIGASDRVRSTLLNGESICLAAVWAGVPRAHTDRTLFGFQRPGETS